MTEPTMARSCSLPDAGATKDRSLLISDTRNVRSQDRRARPRPTPTVTGRIPCRVDGS